MLSLWTPRQMSQPVAELLAQLERMARSTDQGLFVPSWVKKDPKLYARVRGRKFKSQRSLDGFLRREAERRRLNKQVSTKDTRVRFLDTTAPVYGRGKGLE